MCFMWTFIFGKGQILIKKCRTIELPLKFHILTDVVAYWNTINTKFQQVEYNELCESVHCTMFNLIKNKRYKFTVEIDTLVFAFINLPNDQPTQQSKWQKFSFMAFWCPFAFGKTECFWYNLFDKSICVTTAEQTVHILSMVIVGWSIRNIGIYAIVKGPFAINSNFHK